MSQGECLFVTHIGLMCQIWVGCRTQWNENVTCVKRENNAWMWRATINRIKERKKRGHKILGLWEFIKRESKLKARRKEWSLQYYEWFPLQNNSKFQSFLKCISIETVTYMIFLKFPILEMYTIYKWIWFTIH